LPLGSAPGEGYLSAPGTLRAYDVITGKIVWAFHTVPHPGEEGYETWPKDAWKYVGGANTWGELSIDARRGIAYFPTGSPTYDYYGADRIGSNFYANSLIALDARTGKRGTCVVTTTCGTTTTAAPQLITVMHDGRRTTPSPRRQARLPVRLDRETGSRRCGRSRSGRSRRAPCRASRPGRRSRSTRPAPFARQQMTSTI
jgi:glucose dehydrogenase